MEKKGEWQDGRRTHWINDDNWDGAEYCENKKVKEIREKLGDFDYDKEPYISDKPTESRPETEVGNHAMYEGDWLTGTEIREGKGKKILRDGSMYEGYWKDNKANGSGRLIHAVGDFYEGQWLADKADGFGVY